MQLYHFEILAKYSLHILFQGEIIKSGPDNGFIMNEGNLIIQSVKRSSEG